MLTTEEGGYRVTNLLTVRVSALTVTPTLHVPLRAEESKSYVPMSNVGPDGKGNIYVHTRRRIEKRYREGLDGRVWGHWSVRGGAFCEPAKREGARILQW